MGEPEASRSSASSRLRCWERVSCADAVTRGPSLDEIRARCSSRERLAGRDVERRLHARGGDVGVLTSRPGRAARCEARFRSAVEPNRAGCGGARPCADKLGRAIFVTSDARTVRVAGTDRSDWSPSRRGSLSTSRTELDPGSARRAAAAAALRRAAARAVPRRQRGGVRRDPRPLPAAAVRLRAPDALPRLAPGRRGRACRTCSCAPTARCAPTTREVNLRAWLYRVAHNRCIDHLRRPTPPPAEIFEMSRKPLHDPIEEAQRREDLRAARRGRRPAARAAALGAADARDRRDVLRATSPPRWTSRSRPSSRCSSARGSASSRPPRRATPTAARSATT